MAYFDYEEMKKRAQGAVKTGTGFDSNKLKPEESKSKPFSEYLGIGRKGYTRGKETPTIPTQPTTEKTPTKEEALGELLKRLEGGEITDKEMGGLEGLFQEPKTAPSIVPKEDTVITDTDSIRQEEEQKIVDEQDDAQKEIDKQDTEIAKLMKRTELRNARIAAGLDPDTGEARKPDTTLEEKLEGLRTDSGIEKLDTQLNDVNAQLLELQDAKDAALASSREKFLLTGDIGLSQREVSRGFDEEIKKLQREQSILTSQINTKNAIISETMKYAEKDYNTSKIEYQQEFDNQYKLMNYYNAEASDDVKTATSNLNTMTNTLSKTNVSWADMDEMTKSKINELELQAGIPQGFTESVLSAIPEGKVESSKFSYDAAGNEIYTQIISDADGNISVVKTPTGNVATKKISGVGTGEGVDSSNTLNEIDKNIDVSGERLFTELEDKSGLNPSDLRRVIKESKNKDEIMTEDVINKFKELFKNDKTMNQAAETLEVEGKNITSKGWGLGRAGDIEKFANLFITSLNKGRDKHEFGLSKNETLKLITKQWLVNSGIDNKYLK